MASPDQQLDRMSEYTAKRARTRGQLLAAGQEMLPGALRRGLEHALGPGPVSQRAGLSRQTWYRYWRADDTAYLDELTRTALDTVRLLMQPILDRLHTPRGDSGPLDALIRDVARAHFALVTQRRIALVHLLVAALAVEDQFLEAESGIRPTGAPAILHDYYERLTEALVDVYAPLIQQWRRVPVAPLATADLVTRITALADGFALRHVADPDGLTADGFADAVVTTLRDLTVAGTENG
ncbi:MAG: hypothetical protein ACT4OX_03965 [Actinomycetota bacterium]